MATALVTGANRGIGLALCRLLKQRGDDVIGVCRRSSAALDDLGARVINRVEMISDDSIAKLARTLAGTSLDLVILNAGNGSGGSYGYRMSKAALNAAGVSLAVDLRPRGVAVAILHPGFVRTEMTGGAGNVDAAEAAKMLLGRIDALTLETTGRFQHANGETLPW